LASFFSFSIALGFGFSNTILRLEIDDDEVLRLDILKDEEGLRTTNADAEPATLAAVVQ